MLRSGGLRVLVADDDPAMRSRLRAQLIHLGHLVVAEARNGRQAVVLAGQLCPDLVVMDVEMPVMDGLAASERIDQEGICPIILLSAYGDPDSVRRACSVAAVQAYLVKPVDERDLLPAVVLALNRYWQMECLRREERRRTTISDTHSALRQATDWLIARHQCSSQEAQEWIRQEARAKKARLDTVARELLAQEAIDYCSEGPVLRAS
jgi:response regulator NasT